MSAVRVILALRTCSSIVASVPRIISVRPAADRPQQPTVATSWARLRRVLSGDFELKGELRAWRRIYLAE